MFRMKTSAQQHAAILMAAMGCICAAPAIGATTLGKWYQTVVSKVTNGIDNRDAARKRGRPSRHNPDASAF